VRQAKLGMFCKLKGTCHGNCSLPVKPTERAME
jgi:hypothetical protein